MTKLLKVGLSRPLSNKMVTKIFKQNTLPHFKLLFLITGPIDESLTGQRCPFQLHVFWIKSSQACIYSSSSYMHTAISSEAVCFFCLCCLPQTGSIVNLKIVMDIKNLKIGLRRIRFLGSMHLTNYMRISTPTIGMNCNGQLHLHIDRLHRPLLQPSTDDIKPTSDDIKATASTPLHHHMRMSLCSLPHCARVGHPHHLSHSYGSSSKFPQDSKFPSGYKTQAEQGGLIFKIVIIIKSLTSARYNLCDNIVAFLAISVLPSCVYGLRLF